MEITQVAALHMQDFPYRIRRVERVGELKTATVTIGALHYIHHYVLLVSQISENRNPLIFENCTRFDF